MKELIIKASCGNCSKAKYVGRCVDLCKKTGKQINFGSLICSDWKPTKKDMVTWIKRATP
jgi:hypothetical protein